MTPYGIPIADLVSDFGCTKRTIANMMVVFNGESITAFELSRRAGIPASRVYFGLNKGKSVDEILGIA